MSEWALQDAVHKHAMRHAGNAVAAPLARELKRAVAHLIQSAKADRFVASHVSEMVGMVGEITGLKGIVFRAMYIIQVGVGPTYTPRNYSCTFTSEWALDIEVTQGEFAKVLLAHDQASNVYIPI